MSACALQIVKTNELPYCSGISIFKSDLPTVKRVLDRKVSATSSLLGPDLPAEFYERVNVNKVYSWNFTWLKMFAIPSFISFLPSIERSFATPPVPPEVGLSGSPNEPPNSVELMLLNLVQIESPFGWIKQDLACNLTKFFPTKPSISLTATRISKFIAYIPIFGTIIGISRIYEGYHEYKFFNKHQDAPKDLTKNSIKWIIRGSLETIPVFGGVVCLITDIVVTVLAHPFFAKVSN